MWEFESQGDEIKIDINELRTFQNLLKNFKTKINTIQTNYDLLSNSKQL
jgi:hypothetical protein